jgi:hypothetical protein
MPRRTSKRSQVAGGKQTCGSDRVEAWWLLLSREIGEASRRFWSATPERREIEAKRRKNDF